MLAASDRPSRRALFGIAAAAGTMAAVATAAVAQTGRAARARGSAIDPRDVQIVFADLQSPLVSGSTTQPPDKLERSATVLAEVAKILSLPTLFSVVMEGGSPPHLLPSLKRFAGERNTILRIPVAPFHDAPTVAALRSGGRRTLVIAGYAAEAVVLQTALDAIAAGYRVYFVTDAIGSHSARTEAAAFGEMQQAGATPASVLSLATRLVPDFVDERGKQILAALQPVINE